VKSALSVVCEVDVTKRWAFAGIAVTAVFLCGCTAIPTGGAVHAGTPKGDSNPVGAQVHVPPQGPWAGESPDQIVKGFRLASADLADLKVARSFLVDPSWQPQQGVRVVDESDSGPSYSSSGDTAKVHFSDTWDGTLGVDSTYQPQKTGAKIDYTYELVKNDQTKGEWRIVNPPPYMTSTSAGIDDFYRQGYVYYLSPRDQLLVPVRVFLPVTATDFATELVYRLLQPPPAWLSAAGVTSAIPPHTSLLHSVSEADSIVTVNLSSEVASLSAPERDALSAQVIYTLQDYGSATKIQVVGQTLQNSKSVALQTTKTWQAYDPDALKVDFHYIGPDHGTRDSDALVVSGDLGSGAVKLAVPVLAPRLANAPGGDLIAGVETNGSSQALYVGPLSQPKRVDFGIAFTTPSWDALGNVWTVRQETATGPQEVRESAVTPAGTTKFQTVQNNELGGSELIQSLKVSRDGTRVAVIAQSTPAGAQLLVGHVVKTPQGQSIEGFYPVAPSLVPAGDVVWSSATTLEVLATAPGASSPSVWSVDVDGWKQTAVLAPSNVVAIAAAPNQPLVVATKSGEIEVSRNDFWQVVGSGTNPSYPG
jgi:hypothetical protein